MIFGPFRQLAILAVCAVGLSSSAQAQTPPDYTPTIGDPVGGQQMAANSPYTVKGLISWKTTDTAPAYARVSITGGVANDTYYPVSNNGNGTGNYSCSITPGTIGPQTITVQFYDANKVLLREPTTRKAVQASQEVSIYQP